MHEARVPDADELGRLAPTRDAGDDEPRRVDARLPAEPAQCRAEVLERDAEEVSRETGLREVGERERGVAVGCEERRLVAHREPALGAAEEQDARVPRSCLRLEELAVEAG
jgi:hypothetical protein